VIVGIMQPTYLPWQGYFHMINKCDKFVFLDNVQFEKKSWQHRNRIKTSSGELMLTVPVKTAGLFNQKIKDVEIFDAKRILHKHLASIASAYKKTAYFDSYQELFEATFNKCDGNLANLNIELIKKIVEILNIDTQFIRGSELRATGNGTKLTVAQLLEVGATKFFCAAGARPYVSEEAGFAEFGISVEYQDFLEKPRAQLFGPYLEKLSIIDLIFNCGPTSSSFIHGS